MHIVLILAFVIGLPCLTTVVSTVVLRRAVLAVRADMHANLCDVRLQLRRLASRR